MTPEPPRTSPPAWKTSAASLLVVADVEGSPVADTSRSAIGSAFALGVAGQVLGRVADADEHAA